MKIFPKKLLLVILATGLFLPIFDAYAQEGWFSGIAYGAASNLFAYSLQIVFSVIGTLMGVLVQLLAWTVNIRIYYTGVPVIEESWKIMRDFANMLFIIALIVMAYGTIFNIPKYDFKSLIPRFIVVAVLINFSLVLGGLMIDATQVLNNTFLAAMGDISGQLGQGLDVTTLLPKSQNLAGGGEAVSNLAFSAIINLLFGIFMFFAILVSVAVPLVVAFVRIPILWALLIVSPMAWLLSILPATKGAYDNWWKQFLGWNLFLPYYLFSLYFALYFLGNIPKVIEGLGQTFVDSSLTGLGGNFTFSLIFSYALVAVFLIGGTKVAMNAGQFSGTGIVSVAKWGRDRVANRIGWTAAGRAVKGRLGEAGEREEARVKRQEAFMREGLGYVTGGRRGFVEEQLVKDVGESKKKLERITDESQLREIMRTERTAIGTKKPERDRLAAAEILKKRGLLRVGVDPQTGRPVDEYADVYKLYGGNKTLAGREFALSADFSKFAPQDRERWLKSDVGVEVKRKILEAMADKGDRYLTREDEGAEQNLNQALNLYTLASEQRDLLKKIEKHNLELAINTGLQRKLLMKEGNVIEDFKIALEEVVRRMNPDALLEATRGLTNLAGKEVGGIKIYKDTILGSLNPQKIEAMMAKGTQDQLVKWGGLDPERFNPEKIKQEKERLARELAEVTGKATGEAIVRAGGLGGRQGGGGQPPQGPAPAQPRRPAGFMRPGEVAQEGNVVDLRNRENQQ